MVGTKIQERHQCGLRLEAQLTGRAESAVEGFALPQDTLCSACAPQHGSHVNAFFWKLKKEEAGTDGLLRYTIQKREYQRRNGLWQGCNGSRPQMTLNCNSHTLTHKRIVIGTGTSGTPRRCWNGTVNQTVDPAHGSSGTGAPGRKTRTALRLKHRQCVSKTMKKRHPCSQSRCSPGSFYRGVFWRCEREDHDAGSNKEQISA